MELILKYRNCIYGFLILWIVIFHIERVIGLPGFIPIVTPFIQRGNSAVDVFMFLSGFCLCLSLTRDSNLKKFYTKRFKRVVATYLIIGIPFFFWKSMEEFSSMRFAHFLFDFSGLSFWLNGTQNAWFVHAIIFFYIITPLLFKIVKQSLKLSLTCLWLLYLLNFIAYYYIPLYQFSSIAWTRLPIFLIGIIMAYYIPHFEFPNRKYYVILSTLFGILLLLFIPSSLKGFYCWLLYAIIVIPLLWILSSLFKRLPKNFSSIFSALGNISLELYLCHIMILHITRFYKLDMSLRMWMYLLIPTIAIISSFGIANISKYIVKNN